MKTEKRESVEDYLCSFPEKQRDLLNQLRMLIKKTMPQIEEKLSWGAADLCSGRSLLPAICRDIKNI